jgi:hypothetical protein
VRWKIGCGFIVSFSIRSRLDAVPTLSDCSCYRSRLIVCQWYQEIAMSYHREPDSHKLWILWNILAKLLKTRKFDFIVSFQFNCEKIKISSHILHFFKIVYPSLYLISFSAMYKVLGCWVSDPSTQTLTQHQHPTPSQPSILTSLIALLGWRVWDILELAKLTHLSLTR